MKRLFLIYFSFIPLFAAAQEKPTALIEPYLDLKLTDTERDSLLENLQSMKEQLSAIHQFTLPNDIAPALLFNPFPSGFTPEQVKKKSDFKVAEAKMPVNKADLAFYSVEQLASLLKSGKISSVELTQFFINRFKKYADTLQNTITLLEKEALAKAAKADEEIKAGKYRGPLHGIPYGIKDLLAVEGTKTTWGAMPYKDQEINTTATVVKRLEEAGAILVAKLTLGALAMGDIWYGGKTKNPWNLEQGSSGSSAGSAAAVSAGLIPFAIGTETWGSIISPSTRCGVSGLRPTYGRVSRYGAMALSWSMDKIGPIARSSKDLAIIFDAIHGIDPKDPATVQAGFSYAPLKDLKNLKVGYLAEYFERDYPGKENDQKTLETLRNAGADLKPVSLPDSFPVYPLSIILMAEGAAAFDQLTRENLDDLLVNQGKNAWPNFFRAARFIPAVDYINANRIRRQLQNSLHEVLKDYDVIIAPTYGGQQLLMTNLTGQPAVVVPNGFSKNGTPTSITFLGNLFDEATILAVAQLYQENSEYDNMHPPMFK